MRSSGAFSATSSSATLAAYNAAAFGCSATGGGAAAAAISAASSFLRASSWFSLEFRLSLHAPPSIARTTPCKPRSVAANSRSAPDRRADASRCNVASSAA
ncbi:MAG TPA: hypothetical protein VL100_12305 [Croceibacterium sp.]|nr:hypothetical protein [Croceibacterium sp.]